MIPPALNGSVSIEIGDAEIRSTRVSLKDRLDTVRRSRGNHGRQHSSTIFMVPPHLRNDDAAAYEPKVISIGPYHRHKVDTVDAFKQTEQLKLWCLDMILEITRYNCSIDGYLTEMREIEARARNCYSNQIDTMDADEFSEMLLLDGCFILCYLLVRFSNLPFISGYFGYLFRGIKWAWVLLMKYDLLLLENQIPFFILNKLYEIVISSREDVPPLIDELVHLFCKETLINLIRSSPPTEREPHHLLDMLHCYIRPEQHEATPTTCCLRLPSFLRLRCRKEETTLPGVIGYVDERLMSIPTATELHDAGIAIRYNEEAGILDLSFKNGVLEIPRLVIEDYTFALLQNLVALEQCRSECGEHMAPYVGFMNDLVKNHTDVELLRRKGVIVNCLGKDEEVAASFVKLSKNVFLSYKKSHMKNLVMDLNLHYTRRRLWVRYKSELIRDYIGSPWKVASVIAAAILLVLTFIQTIYTVRSN